MHREISNSDNIIDSRDVIRRIRDLENDQQDALDAATKANVDLDDTEPGVDIPQELTNALDAIWTGKDGQQYSELVEAWDEDALAELQALKKLADEAEGCGDWGDGAILIAEDYFEQYAQGLAEDIGAIDHNAKWPLNHIDWEAACKELQNDYTQVEYDGNLYWVRD